MVKRSVVNMPQQGKDRIPKRLFDDFRGDSTSSDEWETFDPEASDDDEWDSLRVHRGDTSTDELNTSEELSENSPDASRPSTPLTFPPSSPSLAFKWIVYHSETATTESDTLFESYFECTNSLRAFTERHGGQTGVIFLSNNQEIHRWLYDINTQTLYN